MLAKLNSRSQRDWDFHLHIIGLLHEGTGFTPCQFFLGREVVLPIDLVLNDCRLDNTSSVLSCSDYVDKVDELIKRLKNRFGTEGEESLHLTERNMRRQKSSESITVIYNDIKTHSCLASSKMVHHFKNSQ